MADRERQTVHIHILSDATGLGNERLARAALVQFRQSLEGAQRMLLGLRQIALTQVHLPQVAVGTCQFLTR